MAQIKVYYDQKGNVIGFEKLNYKSPLSSGLNVAFETVAV